MADAPAPPEPLAPEPAAAPAAPAAAPQRAQVSQAPDAKHRRLQNAMTFLRNPQVRSSPMSRRVNFLKGKGLSVDEIVEAFAAVGNPQTKDAIQGLVDGSAAPDRPAAAAAAAPPPQAAAPVPQYAGQQPQYAAPPPPPPPPEKKGWSWQDMYIGGTMAAGGMYAASRLLTQFVDIDIRKKGQAPPRPARRSRPAPVPRGGMVSDDADELSQAGGRSAASAPATAAAGDVSRLSRLIDEKSAELGERITALEGKIDTCEPEKLGELKKQMSNMLNEAAGNKSNLEKRLAKLHHIDRLPHMQTRIAGTEDGIRRLDEIVEGLRKKNLPEGEEAPPAEPSSIPQVSLGEPSAAEGAVPTPLTPAQPDAPATPAAVEQQVPAAAEQQESPAAPQTAAAPQPAAAQPAAAPQPPLKPWEQAANTAANAASNAASDAPAVFGLQEAPAATGVLPGSQPPAPAVG